MRVVGADGTPLVGQRVVFAASSGTVDTATYSDHEGWTQARWSGAAAGDVVTVDAVTSVRGIRVARRLILPGRRPVRVELDAVSLQPWASRGPQHWFADRQTRTPATVAIRRADDKAMDEATCAEIRVIFRDPGGGSPVVDTARTSWERAGVYAPKAYRGRGTCTASTLWKLGSTVGDQQLRASVAGQPDAALTLRGKAHRLPWIGIGLALSNPQGYTQLQVRESTLRVTTRDPATGVEIARDSTVRERELRDVARGAAFTPTIGINFTPFLLRNLNVLRVSVAADARNLDGSWFAGISLPRLFDGLVQEAVETDIQVVAHVLRRDDVAVGSGCGAAALAACRRGTDLQFGSVGLMVQINSSSLLSQLIDALK